MQTGSRAGYRDISAEVKEESDIDGFEIATTLRSRQFSKNIRSVLPFLLVVAVVAGSVEAVHYALNLQKKHAVDDTVNLWKFDKASYCSAFNGILHPLKKKCCDKECGTALCGTDKCFQLYGNGNEIASSQACCAAAVPLCSPAHTAPCMIPAQASLGEVTMLYGGLSFSSTAKEGAVRKGVGPALVKYFDVAPTDIDVTRVVSVHGRRLNGAVVNKTKVWSADFSLTTYKSTKDGLQKKANDVYTDSSPLQHELETAITGVIKLTSFTSPKNTNPHPTTTTTTATAGAYAGPIPPAPTTAAPALPSTR